MDIDARIERRRRRDGADSLISSREALSPVAHVDEPSDRGPVLEGLLDHLDPVFEGRLPPNAYVHGAFGSGKSAIVTALFTHLGRLPSETRSVIHTSTRAASPISPGFVRVDVRQATSAFAFYHDVLDALVEDAVPEHGISTAELRSRLHDVLGDSGAGVVVAVDHADEWDGADAGDVTELFAGLPSTASWLAVGRTPPDETALTEYTSTSIEVGPCRRQMLVDVLMTRASDGLTQQALDHDLARRIAGWADGNAHDALAALFVAADRADRADRNRLVEADVTAAFEEIPEPSVSLDRVLSLPANRQLVLRELVDLDPADRASVTATTEALSALPAIDLSTGTVKRYLYEMAEDGIVERVRSERSPDSGKGRPPSRVDLRFPPTVFRRLYDLRE
ncbi:MAG: Cdc6/Cdc18 family protein [Salinirussus sp.]